MPGPLRRVFEEVVTTGHVLRGSRGSTRWARPRQAGPGPLRRQRRRDPELVDSRDHGRRRSGRRDRARRRRRRSRRRRCGARALAGSARSSHLFRRDQGAAPSWGETRASTAKCRPIHSWQLLPDDVQFLFDDKRGPLLTVHPLGGCPMGEAARDDPDPRTPNQPRAAGRRQRSRAGVQRRVPAGRSARVRISVSSTARSSRPPSASTRR